jgi:hypothetical protein
MDWSKSRLEWYRALGLRTEAESSQTIANSLTQLSRSDERINSVDASVP